MKTQALVITTAILGLVFTSCQQSFDATNRAKDASFESGALGAAWYFQAWKPEGSKGSVEATVAHTGKASGLVSSDKANHAQIIQKIKAESNAFYIISAWVKTDNAQTAKDEKDADPKATLAPDAKVIGANLGVESVFGSSRQLTGTNDWTELKLGLETRGGVSEVAVMLNLGAYGALATGKAWFDDLSFQRVEKIPEGLETVVLGK